MQTYVQITVNVPVEDADRMRKIIGDAGAGRIGKYAYGSFSTKGIGRGMALEGADPAVGDIGELEETPEERIEAFCTSEDVERIVKIIKENHPYEEPIITVCPVDIY